MAYTKTIWIDYPNEDTIINADKLNNIENGISNLDTKTTMTTLYSGIGTGTITLSDRIENYDHLIVYFYGLKNSSMIVATDGSYDVTLSSGGQFEGSYYALRISTGYFVVSTAEGENTKIAISSQSSNYTADIKTTGEVVFYDNKTSYTIYKVVGYKC